VVVSTLVDRTDRNGHHYNKLAAAQNLVGYNTGCPARAGLDGLFLIIYPRLMQDILAQADRSGE
jgi:hypothetical protein